MTRVKQQIYTEEIDIFFILLISGTTIELQNIILAQNCNSILILLGKIQKYRIIYDNN